MRVSLFGLFLRCTSLMEPWPKLVRSVLLVIGFIRFIGFYRFYVNLRDIWCCPIYSTSHHLTCSYLIILSVFSTGSHLLYLLAPACLPMLATWLLLHTRLGSFIWLPWILMSRSWSMERVDSPSCWSEWRSGSVDLQQTVQSSILPGPLFASRVFLL